MMGDDIEHSAHSVATTIVDGVKLIALCITTLDGKAAEEKQHYLNGSRTPSKFVPHCDAVEECYDGMTASDIVNRNAQFLISI
eukprot:14471421-Ditylum_brightwellii.AAC.1